MKNIWSESTPQPQGKIEYAGRKTLSKEQWNDLSIDLMSGVQAALAGREPLEQNLAEWNDVYEMLTTEKDWPWPNSSNLVTPLVATELEALVAYIAGQVLVPRLFLVSGLTQIAAATANDVERYANSELKRQRGDSTWFEQLVEWLHLGTRDGLGYIECLWKYKKTKLKVYQISQKMAPDEQGAMAPVLGPDGLPMTERVLHEVEDVYNDVTWKAVELRNVLTIPAEATSIQDAMAVIRVDYLYEDQLNEMVHSDKLHMDADEVEQALSFVPSGSTELASSPQPLSTYTAGDTISIGIGQGTQTTKFFRNRGPVEVYRIHSRQYDLDGDGTPEENIFWVHSKTWRLLGWTRYEYFSGVRPFFPFAPFSRPNRLIGFSLVGRLIGLQNERDALRNQRLDEGSIRLSPPWVGKKGSSLEDSGLAWGPNQTWWTDDPATDFKRLEQGPVPQSSFAEESLIVQDAKEYTGMANPMLGMQSGGKRSATEARMWQAAAMTRTGLLAMRFRMAIRPLINFTFALKRQYLTDNQNFVDQSGAFTLPLQVINQDYQIDVSGASDPIDASARRAETANAYELLMGNPIVSQDPMHTYALTRKLVESLDWGPEADKILGTEQDLLKKIQQAQQAQQAQAQAQQGQGGAPPGGAPSPGGPPHPPGPPGGPPSPPPQIHYNYNPQG